MKHGLALEPHAKRELKNLFLHHKKVRVIDVGLFIMKSHPFVGASADSILRCDCCGTFIIEIKCPHSIKEDVPSSENLDYLITVEEDGQLIYKLKNNHKYYYQVQGQMGVMNVHPSYFFVFTHNGYYLEKIEFDKEFWEYTLYHLNSFWINHIGPALLSPDGKKQKPHTKSLMSLLAANNHPAKGKKKLKLKAKKNTENLTAPSKIVCGTCLKPIVEIPRQPSEDSIICATCEIWYHVKCTNEISLTADDWKCTFCSD